MKGAILISITICLVNLFDSGVSLQCHHCTSSRDWQECDEKMLAKECPSNADRCAKIKKTIDYQGSKVINYDRKCYVKEACGDFCQRYAEQGVECVINCCEGDLCNSSVVPVTSGWLLWTCAVLVILQVFTTVAL